MNASVATNSGRRSESGSARARCVARIATANITPTAVQATTGMNQRIATEGDDADHPAPTQPTRHDEHPLKRVHTGRCNVESST